MRFTDTCRFRCHHHDFWPYHVHSFFVGIQHLGTADIFRKPLRHHRRHFVLEMALQRWKTRKKRPHVGILNLSNLQPTARHTLYRVICYGCQYLLLPKHRLRRHRPMDLQLLNHRLLLHGCQEVRHP